MTPAEKLKALVDKEFEEVLAVMSSRTAYMELLEIIRQIETAYIAGGSSEDSFAEQKLFESVRMGWMRPLSFYLKNLQANLQPLTFASKLEGKIWALNLLKETGSLELVDRWITAEKAGIVEISEPDENKFKVTPLHEIVEKEHYDRESIAYVNRQIELKNQNAFQRHTVKFKNIEKQMLGTLQIVDDTFIKYSTTPDIDRYYSQLGYFHLSNNLAFDDFGGDDVFGGIPYKLYLRVLEEVCGVALKHFDYCKIAVRKNGNVDFFNILPYSFYEDKTLLDFSQYLKISLPETSQIFGCLTLDTGNISYHELFKGNILAPYVRTGPNQLTRTFFGAWEGGIDFLKRELKRRFEDDYFKAVNKREARFRDDIYRFFKGNRFVTTSEEIEIKLPGLHTDIDGVVFDKKTRSLGIFQLKWQDMFYASLQERRSRISNLYPKASEWIDKIERWTTSYPKKEIMTKLKFNLTNEAGEFENVYLFVITRNQVHFTGIEPDERAAWATMFQLIESYDFYKLGLNDPVKELYHQIKMGLPSNRVKEEGYPQMPSYTVMHQTFELQL
ncbi:hypothetical protein [Mucilaginibacter sp. BT774]|uniref:hypothetical protein n=1 Tax=Mucilaginibacter sp. BT774 TaxID=3062276 RepID=UPI0026772997|nr:hypothetical protein [Mucilaginibacter sp. BT774]MDO3627604.1 hypothetical protein [Mucilaginibacter sp. BT774]